MLASKNAKRKRRLYIKQNTFKENWVLIKNKIPKNQCIEYINDFYFYDVPNRQEVLTDINVVCRSAIDYSNYIEPSKLIINKNNLYECFHGILFYIYFYSANKFNIEEIEIHFSGAKYYFFESYNKKFNIINIFDYENINKKIDIDCSIDAFFGITFKRIHIQPVCYAIRSAPISGQISNLISFTFEGFDEQNQKWDILDERENINSLICGSGFALFYVRSTTKTYSSFKIKQTGVGSNNGWGFSLSAFDIHGKVYYREEFTNVDNSVIEENIDSDIKFFDIDPCIDMTDLLI